MSQFEVAVIGGSFGGLSAALTLARTRRSILLIDAGHPRNERVSYSHGFLTQDGKTPSEILSVARAQVLAYPTVTYLPIECLAIEKNSENNGYAITLGNGETHSATKLVLATGVKDILPGIPGAEECWAISMFHCP